MPDLHFTPQLRRFVPTPAMRDVVADRLAVLLQQAFAQQAALRGYLLDDQGALRPNVAVFVDGVRVQDLQTALRADSQVYVMQALSGG